jgi:hypothetical protein
MFGNVNDEQDMSVFAMDWICEDVIVVNFSHASSRIARCTYRRICATTLMKTWC